MKTRILCIPDTNYKHEAIVDLLRRGGLGRDGERPERISRQPEELVPAQAAGRTAAPAVRTAAAAAGTVQQPAEAVQRRIPGIHSI